MKVELLLSLHPSKSYPKSKRILTPVKAPLMKVKSDMHTHTLHNSISDIHLLDPDYLKFLDSLKAEQEKKDEPSDVGEGGSQLERLENRLAMVTGKWKNIMIVLKYSHPMSNSTNACSWTSQQAKDDPTSWTHSSPKSSTGSSESQGTSSQSSQKVHFESRSQG